MRHLLFWLFDNVPLGPLAPWVFALALWRWPKKMKKPDQVSLLKVLFQISELTLQVVEPVFQNLFLDDSQVLENQVV